MRKQFAFILVIFILILSCKHDTLAPADTSGSSDNTSTTGDGTSNTDTTSTGSDTTSTSNSDTTAGDTTQVALCYNKDIAPILNSYCAYSGCHNSITAAENYDFSSYHTTMRAVNAGNATGSKLYQVIVATDRKKMPPYGLTRLTPDEANKVKTWITQGAAESCGG